IFDYNKYVSRRTMAAWLYYIARLDTNLKNRYDALYTQYRASTTFDPTDTGATASLKLAIITLRMDALPLATQNAAGQYNTRFTFIPEAEESILTIYKMLGIEPQPQPEPLPETNNFCPAYTQSELLAARPRANQIIINPSANSNDYQWLISISQAGPDTEVLLRDGIYYFPGAYDLPYNQMQIHSNVTVRSFSGNRDNVVIRGKGYDVGSEGFLVTGQNVDIADLSITNMRNHGIAIKGELGAEATHIYNVSMYDIGTQFIKGAPDAQDGSNNNLIACSSFGYSALDKIKGDYIAAIDLHRFHNTHIRDNTIYNFMGDGSGCEVDISCGTYVTHPAVLIWNQSSGTILERNVFTNNFRSIALGLTSGHTGGIIRNNFIYRSLDGDAGIELQTATGTRVYNNTVRIAGYNGAIEARQSSNLDIRNNLLSSPFYDRGGLTGVTLANNISNATDTDFISADSPHIVDGSRLIGAGVVLADVTADFDGDLRNGSNDIGADQWSSSGTSPQPPQPLPTPVESTLVLSNAEDTWLGSNAEESAASFGGDTILQTYSTVSAGGNARVSLLKFDLSQIPAGATITDAKIEFYVQSIDYPSSPSVIIHRVSQNWLEGTDTGAWDNQPVDGANWASRGPGIGNWSSAGGSIAEPLCQLTLVNLSMNSCTVTSLVQQWLNGSTANNGIRIANTNEYNDVVSISSSESANAANRPRLVVQYTSGTAPQVQNDSDGDGISDSVDNCPLIANANQADSDADNLGNACDPTPNGDDIDHDGVADSLDNCPQIANSDQGNLDNDSLGNACDPDDDNDGIIDSSDNCPYNSNANQSDRDGDGLGDICDPTPDSNPPDQNGNSDNLRETKLQRIATRVATFTQNATLAQPTNFVAVNRNGQTFLTWTENSAITGEKYVIYRSTNPINADTLGQATPIALIAENSSYYRTEAIRDGSVQQRFIIENNGAQLAATTGLFVNTPHEAGNFYYAIATNSGAQANLTSFANSNSLANSINETTDDPKPILVATAQSNGRTGRIYTQFMDYHNWNETMHGYAYNYSVSVDDNYNPASNESMQIALHMEGKNSRYANVEIYGDGIWIRIDSPYFASYSEQDWYWGYSCNNDFQNATRQVVDNGPICNFTELRTIRAIKDTIEDPFYANHADVNRIYAYGHSMGASGVLSLAMHYPKIVSAVYASQGMTDYSTDPVWRNENLTRWGSLATNNPVLNLGIQWIDGTNTAASISQLNGMGIWDYMDHKTIACSPAYNNMETAFIIATHGSIDGSIQAATQGYPFYDCLSQGHRGFVGQIDNADHGWQQYEPQSPINFRPLIDPWGAWEVYDFPVTQSYPAFTLASDSDFGATNGLADYNITLDWDPNSMVDTANRYEVMVNSTAGNQIVDITPRRTQQFIVLPNTIYNWENQNTQGNVLASGTSQSNELGVLTVNDFSVSSMGNKLVITR
ncbi:MAG: hypothetical protein ACD_73C00357G0002, partial [uncultured bacterium]